MSYKSLVSHSPIYTWSSPGGFGNFDGWATGDQMTQESLEAGIGLGILFLLHSNNSNLNGHIRLNSMYVCISCMLIQPCLILYDPMDCSIPGSSVHGISHAKILEWVAVSSSRGSSQHRNWTCISCVSCLGWQILYHWANQEARACINIYVATYVCACVHICVCIYMYVYGLCWYIISSIFQMTKKHCSPEIIIGYALWGLFKYYSFIFCIWGISIRRNYQFLMILINKKAR